MTRAASWERWLRVEVTLIAVLWANAGLAAPVQTILPGSAIPKWVERMPRLVGQPAGTIQVHLGFVPETGAPGQLTLRMCEVKARILPTGTLAPGVQPETWGWAYLAGDACPDYTQSPAPAPVDTTLGPVIVAQRTIPTEVTYVNELGDTATTNVLAYKTSTDQTLHWADPLGADCMMKASMGDWGNGVMYPPPGVECAWNYSGPIAAVPHLHGGEIPAQIDGSPDSWFTSAATTPTPLFGPKYYTKGGGQTPGQSVYTYPNVQEAAPLWFHDHTLGATRLNVYAGMAGGYYLLDDPAKLAPNMLPVTEVIPLIIQDRMFDTNGQLCFTAGLNGFDPTLASPGWALNPEHPYWNPEFLGDTIMVNGKVWPFVEVEPRRYRFLFLNGSNARTYELFLTNPKTKLNGPSLWVIGNDGGYLDTPALVDPNAAKPNPTKLVIMPGERYEVVIDFTNHAGQTLVMRNTAKAPYPAGAAPSGSTVAQIVQFRVGTCATRGCGDTSFDPAAPGAQVRTSPMERLVAPGTVTPAVAPDLVRQLTLNEVMGMPMTAVNPVNGKSTVYPGGPLEILVNNTKWMGRSDPMAAARGDFTTREGDDIAYSEVPDEGDVELWEIVNITADAHPIHLHLVQFQILNRQSFDAAKYTAAYGLDFPASCTPKDMTGYCPGYGPPLAYGTKAVAQQPSSAVAGPLKRNYLVGGVTVSAPVVGGNTDVVPFLKSVPAPAAPQERGWKDTVMAPPGMITRILVRWGPTEGASRFAFDPSGGGKYNYVWHCHIIDHEDNEMMRPDFVQADASAERTFTQGTELENY